MSLPVFIAVVLWIGVTTYAVFGGADFGSVVWDLLAGGARRGARTRALVDLTIGSVWEANHVWLIFCLVVLWTAFSPAFAAIMTTLFAPLMLAAFGIVLRGSGFAYRHATTTFASRRLFGMVFAASSLITPFFLGAVAGGIASGRVPADGSGDPIEAWVNPTSLFGGVLAVASCAFLSATFLFHDAQRYHDSELERGFVARGIASGALCGVLALGGIVVLRADAPYLFDQLTHEGLSLMLLSGACGLSALWLLHVRRTVWARLAAVGAVATVVWGWGLAQYPYLLPETITIDAAASSSATLWALVGVVVAAVVIVVPSFVLLMRLSQGGLLGEDSISELAAENAPT